MSSSLLEEKENVNIPNEFAKEGKTTTKSSILKPSQRENVSSVQQLTPQKPPKVTFKNTPVHYRPACYKVELTQSQLDTWEEIRSLDELENWTERTQVVTKEDHQIHLEAAREFLEDIINNLPCIKSPEAQAEKTVKSEDIKEKSPSKVVEPVETKQECTSSVEENKSVSKVIPDKIMDDGFDNDSAGPLDPAIASLNSLLKAGEDEERAFSPIGSERTSPDCDAMVTSEDIEKLLAKNDFQDEGEIPPLELSHGSKFDKMMDLQFGGKSLEEMTRKLDQLRLMSPKIDIGINQTEDNDEDSLPVKRRGAKPSPGKETQDTKDKKENTEEKENIPDDEDFSLPVKRREPKAEPKKQTDTNGDSEKFKKPLPPKPWKTKKVKIPKEEDPFIVVLPGAGESTVNGNNVNAGVDLPKNGSSFAEPKPQPSDSGASQGENSQGENTSDSVIKSQEETEKQPSLKNNENEEGKNKNASVQDDVFLEKQDDFGLENDDFKSSSEAFSLELDYLEKFGNTDNLDRLSALARQSLYVKFDPLVKGSPDQDLKQMKADAINSKQTPPGNFGDLLLMNTPPNRRAQQRLTAIKEAKGKDANNLSDVDKLLTFSPQAKTSNEDSSKQSFEPPKSTAQDNHSDESHDPSLVEPLLYSKSDIAVAVKKEREALLKQTHEESAIRDMEIQEIQSKLQAEVEGNAKLRRENDELRTVMNEYERTLAEMIETSEKNKNMSDESKNEIVKERDQLQADLNSVEAAFSDLHRRYEKLKGVLENYKKNEEILKKATIDYQEKLKKSGEKYQMLKKHAEEKIETANIEINRVRRSNDSEMAVMRAALKKEQNKCASLEQAIQQKINENKELTAICDELIQRASGTN
ncbi:transforming acidic coiled-coil-containing protein 3-like [Actinia tenebrosa]|uniref:Transforming acidic coiled-coil-containing protein 3-like n=1 Tax=Actinia tenebrosa TaxID=6105 RepID=A0A6P8HD01_ACTTE|nr:transforming acidic coiled-coil-containing protein 3-like [Actinia tenebrosa]